MNQTILGQHNTKHPRQYCPHSPDSKRSSHAYPSEGILPYRQDSPACKAGHGPRGSPYERLPGRRRNRTGSKGRHMPRHTRGRYPQYGTNQQSRHGADRPHHFGNHDGERLTRSNPPAYPVPSHALSHWRSYALPWMRTGSRRPGTS